MKLFDPLYSSWHTKLLSGKYMIPATITKEGNRLFIDFRYSEELKSDIKSMGAKYHGFDEYNPRKVWSLPDNAHSRFQLKFLANPGNTPDNPYYIYDQPWKTFTTSRKLYQHQRSMTAHGISTHYCIWGAEMGVGKSLSAIEVMEYEFRTYGVGQWFWVGPRSALVSAKIECKKWNSKITPRFMTYEELQKILTNWNSGDKPPIGIIVDECSRCKNPTAKRTIAVQHLADAIRAVWGDKGFVVEMSGTPAPKQPTDWWSLCEIACPGYLKEGSLEKLKQRLAIIEKVENTMGGGVYPQLVAWKDDENKCNICGLPKDAETHENGVDVFADKTQLFHRFEPSVNEVALLGKRMSGLVQRIYKKDCLDLPEKIYRQIDLQPTQQALNLAEMIKAKSKTAIEALTFQRELSDGFQYTEKVEGTKVCPLCKGGKTIIAPAYADDTTEEQIQLGTAQFVDTEQACPTCFGAGSIDKVVRTVYEVPTPKEDALIELLDEFEEVGRLVICAGFTGSIDRVIRICQKLKWNTIRIDGRGWQSDIIGASKDEEMIQVFQDPNKRIPRCVTVMHPASGGMGLTLTASPAILYYSNDFNFESRAQSEDRIHRAGMDLNKGASIIDLFHLPCDRKIYDNLKSKKNIMTLTLNEI